MGSDVFSTSRAVYGVYSNTQGLDAGRPVNINGNRVGMVERIDFLPDYTGQLVVTFQITTDYPIPSNSVALIAGDVLGNKRVDIMLGDSTHIMQMGDTIPTGLQPGLAEAVNEQLAPLKAKTERLLGSIDTALAVFQGFLTEDTQRDFKKTFENLYESFDHLKNVTNEIDIYMAENRPRLSQITENLEHITSTFSQNSGKLDTIFSNVEAITDTLAQARVAETMAELAKASAQANQLLEKVNNGEGTLGQLFNDQELYDNITKASNSLDRLLLDLRYNPNRYIEFSVFGSSPRYSPEEIEEMERQLDSDSTANSDN